MDNNMNNENQNLTQNNNIQQPIETEIEPKVEQPINFDTMEASQPVVQEPVVEQPVVPQTPTPTVDQPAPEPAPVVEASGEKKGGNKNLIIIIIVVVLLLGVCAWFLFGNKGSNKESSDSNNSGNDQPVVDKDDEASKFVGIYSLGESKIFIKKQSNKSIWYTCASEGLFQGEALISGDKATEKSHFEHGGVFVFKLSGDSIELTIDNKEADTIYSVEEGTYKKIAEYNKDNVYKYAVGDPNLLNSKYSGMFKKDDITLVFFQITDKLVKVEILDDEDKDQPMFSETFEIASDNNLIVKSFFDENAVEFEIKVDGDKMIFKCHDDVFGFDEDNKVLEGTFTKSGTVTPDLILKEYYEFY